MTLVFLDIDGQFPGFGESRNLNLRIEFNSAKSGLYVVKVASSETEQWSFTQPFKKNTIVDNFH